MSLSIQQLLTLTDKQQEIYGRCAVIADRFWLTVHMVDMSEKGRKTPMFQIHGQRELPVSEPMTIGDTYMFLRGFAVGFDARKCTEEKDHF